MPKISELNPITNMSPDNLLMVVNDPNGAPSTNKITFKNFANSVSSYLISGNVVFSNTTVSAAYRNQNLILQADHGNVVISSNNDYSWTFDEYGFLSLNSSSYGEIMGIGAGMGPTIYANSSLYQYVYYDDNETNEHWQHGSVVYPGTNQLWTTYYNDYVYEGRDSNFTLRSDQTDTSAEIYLKKNGPFSEKKWNFGANGVITFPDNGSLTDNFPVVEFRVGAFDQLSWSGSVVSFTNASNTILQDILNELHIGDDIAIDGVLTTISGPYSGGTDGTFEVASNFQIANVQLLQLSDRRNLKEGFRLTTNTYTWTFGTDGDLTVPANIIVGNNGPTESHFIVDGSNYWTSMQWINFSPQPSNTTPFECQSQLLRVFSGTGAVTGHEELVAVCAVQDNDTENGILITTSNGKIPDAPYNDGEGTQYNWLFGGDGNLTLPAGGNILDSNGDSVLGGLEIDGGNASTNYTSEITVDGGGA